MIVDRPNIKTDQKGSKCRAYKLVRYCRYYKYNYNPLGALKPGMIEARKISVEYFFI